MSESEEELSSSSKQKSIFSGMGRVKQINHLREKWRKPPVPDRSFVDPPPSFLSSKRPSRVKLPPSDNKFRALCQSQSVNGSMRSQPAVTTLDMERYLAINTWLEENGINVAHLNRSEAATNDVIKDQGLFDDMYCSLELLENIIQSELFGFRIESECRADTLKNNKDQIDVGQPTAPALFDYLAVIGPDMLDVKMRTFWNHKENVFEATVAFAHPSESQYHAENLEHFCFPNGIKSTNADEHERAKLGEEDLFFVFMISGGGLQGQNVQFAMCLQAAVIIHCGNGDYFKLPICYCIIAQLPFLPFFRAVLQEIVEHLRNDLESSAGGQPISNIVTDTHAGYIDDILQHLQPVHVPKKGSSVSIDVFSSSRSVLTLTRPHNENDRDETVTLLLQWALPSLLSHLSIDRVIQILSLLLLETKLIVISNDISLLSTTTLGFASLLHPLVWAGPLISVLPPSMHEYMEAPIPFICGAHELLQDFECPKSTCVFYILEDRVQRHSDDERVSDNFRMPESKNLSCDLTRFTKQMFGPVAATFRDNVIPLSTHLVVNRIRRHIDYLISLSNLRKEVQQDHAKITSLDASETNFMNEFIRTQMCQKYHDDHFGPLTATPSNQQHPAHQIIQDDLSIRISSVSTNHDDFEAAARVLFQIALAGVSSRPQSNLQ